MSHLEIVFSILSSNQLFVKLECDFGQREVKYLDHIISSA